MLSFLLLPENLPFLAAAGFVGLTAATELGLLALGASLGALFEFGDAPDAPEAGAPLAWLGLGRVPLSILLVTLATGFAGCGFAFQAMALASFGAPLSWPLASAAALVASLPVTAYATAGMAHLVPREESYGTRREELVGRSGVVVQGTATADLPAEARVADAMGRSVYVGVVPAEGGGALRQGTRVVLVARRGINFVAEPAGADTVAPAIPSPPPSGKAPP